jgi:hypothetical protein
MGGDSSNANEKKAPIKGAVGAVDSKNKLATNTMIQGISNFSPNYIL